MMVLTAGSGPAQVEGGHDRPFVNDNKLNFSLLQCCLEPIDGGEFVRLPPFETYFTFYCNG